MHNKLEEAYLNRGILLGELKQLDAALANYDQAISIRADYAEAYCNRGIAQHELTSRMRAGEYARAIEMKPDLPRPT